MTDADKYIKSLQEGFTIDGTWEGEPPFMKPEPRKFIIRPEGASLFGWLIFPYEYHFTGMVDCEFTEGEQETTAEMTITGDESQCKKVRAPLATFIAWHLIGRLMWRWKAWRA